MPQTEVEIVNKLGLHARASAKLTQLAGSYQSEIWLTRNGRRVNAKSIMGVMMLAAGKGAKVGIEIDGSDADAALQAIVELITGKFGEDERAISATVRASAAASPSARRTSSRAHGWRWRITPSRRKTSNSK